MVITNRLISVGWHKNIKTSLTFSPICCFSSASCRSILHFHSQGGYSLFASFTPGLRWWGTAGINSRDSSELSPFLKGRPDRKNESLQPIPFLLNLSLPHSPQKNAFRIISYRFDWRALSPQIKALPNWRLLNVHRKSWAYRWLVVSREKDNPWVWDYRVECSK